MLEQIFAAVVGDTLTFPIAMAVLGAALILGFVISLVYIFTHKKEGYTPSFAVTLVMLPIIISIIIVLVGDNVARAFSLAGAFTIIRFRSAPGDPKDITYVFFTLAVGLACGMGYIAYAVLFTIILCLVMVVINATKYAMPKSNNVILKVQIPENLNYQDLYDDLFEKYTDSWHLKRIKSIDFGALFELVYTIKLKTDIDQKAFIDEVRTRNGNLTVTMTLKEFEEKMQV